MAEYIEREAVLEDIKAAVQHGGMGAVIAGTLRRYVLRHPAADVAPVVRCKDCLYSTDSWAKVNEKGFLICPASGMEITDMDFCSYGERKDGDG